jgi:lipid-A-disaccharide synthase
VIAKMVISAGDTSGDTHAAGLCRALQAAIPGIAISGIGDAAMASTGAHLIANQQHMRQVGVATLLTSAPYHWQLGKRLIQHIKDQQPDVVVLIDYGGFHLRVAKALRQAGWGGKLVYFIPPQVWASRPYRIQTLKQTVNLVLGILPFEAPLYEKHGIPYQFVGHPTTYTLPQPPADRAAACQQLGLNTNWPIVAVMPGSRRMELNYLLPVLRQALPLIQAASTPPIQFVLAQAQGVSLQPVLAEWQHQFGPHLHLSLTDQTHTLQAIANAAIVKSGTSTLETAWYGTPQVIIYKGHWLSYHLVFKRLATVPCLGLPNLLAIPDWANRPETLPYPELLQNELTPYKLAEVVLRLHNPQEPLTYQQYDANQKLQHALGMKESPYEIAAKRLLKFL